MARYLVIQDFSSGTVVLTTGDVIDDSNVNVDRLVASGLLTLEYDPWLYDGLISRYQALRRILGREVVGGLAASLIAGGLMLDSSAQRTVTLVPVADTTYVVGPADLGKTLVTLSADDTQIIVPGDATVSWITGAAFSVLQGADGAVELVGGGINVVQPRPGKLPVLASLEAYCTVMRVGTNRWLPVGELQAETP